MPDRRRAAKRALERVGFALLVGALRVLPFSVARALAGGLGRFAFDVVRIRRAVAVGNVEARLAPDGGRAEAERIARSSYVVMARTFLDLLRVDRIGDARLWRMVRREELDYVRSLRESGGGGLLVSGHFGNWELLVLAIRRLGIPVSALAADQANPTVDAWVKRARAGAGIRTFSSRRELKPALEALRRGEYVATLVDQDARGKGIFVEFLGTPTASHTGVVSMAIRAGRPLIPGALIDEGRGYRFAHGKPWHADPELSEKENLRAGTVHYTRFLEEQVRAHPDNYLWAHRRWKTRPPQEKRGEQEDGP